MAAALGKGLVLDMKRRHTRALHQAHRAFHVGRATESGVSVRHHGQAAGVDDLFHAVHHFGEAEQTDVRVAGGTRDGAAAGVDR